MFRRATVLFARGSVPKLEFEKVADQPVYGFLFRFTAESRNVRFSVTPQLGPRKVDPKDTEPQFDAARRCLTTLSLQDVASVIAVFEGHIPNYKVSADYRHLSFYREDDGFLVEGELVRNDNGETLPVHLKVSGGQLIALKNFFESSLIQGFGFAQYLQGRRRVVTRRPLRRAAPQRRGDSNRPRLTRPPRSDRRIDTRRYDDRRYDTRRYEDYPPRSPPRYRDNRRSYSQRRDYYEPRDRAPRRDYRDRRDY